MHVPGSAASTVHVASLVNSLPRWLLRSHCSLAGFLRSIVQCPADRTDAATSPSRGSSTWPMPLPYPEAFSRGCSVSGLHHKRMVCLHVMVLDWLCLNRPSAAPRELRLGARLTPKQWSAVAVLKRLAWDGNTPDAVDAVSMGRSAAKFESFEADLGAIHRAAFDCLRSTVSSMHALLRRGIVMTSLWILYVQVFLLAGSNGPRLWLLSPFSQSDLFFLEPLVFVLSLILMKGLRRYTTPLEACCRSCITFGTGAKGEGVC